MLFLFFWPRSLSGCSWWCNLSSTCRAVAQKSLSVDLLSLTNPVARIRLDLGRKKKKERSSVSFSYKDHSFTFIVISRLKKQEQLIKNVSWWDVQRGVWGVPEADGGGKVSVKTLSFSLVLFLFFHNAINSNSRQQTHVTLWSWTFFFGLLCTVLWGILTILYLKDLIKNIIVYFAICLSSSSGRTLWISSVVDLLLGFAYVNFYI